MDPSPAMVSVLMAFNLNLGSMHVNSKERAKLAAVLRALIPHLKSDHMLLLALADEIEEWGS